MCTFHRPDQGHWYCQPQWTMENLGTPWLFPKTFHYLNQLQEGFFKQGQMKHNRSLSGTLTISNGVKQGCILAPIFFSIFFRIMLRETCQTASTSISEEIVVCSTCGVSLHAQKPLIDWGTHHRAAVHWRLHPSRPHTGSPAAHYQPHFWCS